MNGTDMGYTLPLLNAFISTVDHLPCDLIRSLWFIQTCNTEAEKLHQKLKEKQQASKLEPQSLVELRERIIQLQQEAIAETESIYNQLFVQKHFLQIEKCQLERINVTRTQQEIDRRLQLREALEKHYAENPLKSQVEALKEQQSRGKVKDYSLKREVMPFKEGKDDKTKLKLILKLPPKSRDRPPKPAKALKLTILKDGKVRVQKKHSKPSTSPSRKPSKAISTLMPKRKPEEKNEEEEEERKPAEFDVAIDEEVYCICRQPSFGNMIACDNKECPNGEWFHYKCVGLLNRVEALQYSKGRKRWYCSQECRESVNQRIQSKRLLGNKRRKKKGSHKWSK